MVSAIEDYPYGLYPLWYTHKLHILHIDECRWLQQLWILNSTESNISLLLWHLMANIQHHYCGVVQCTHYLRYRFKTASYFNFSSVMAISCFYCKLSLFIWHRQYNGWFLFRNSISLSWGRSCFRWHWSVRVECSRWVEGIPLSI